LEQAGHIKQELVDGGVPISGRNIRVMVNSLMLIGSGFALAMTPNGPVIKGGCVTWRSSRAGSRYFSQITVPVQARYAVPRRAERDGGVLFAVMVQILLSAGVVAVQG
jgi:hypothetical protein